MKTKLMLVLLSAFFVVSQSGFAKGINGNAETQKDQTFERYIGSTDVDPFNNNQSYLPYVQIGGTNFFNVNSAKAAVGADLFVPLWQEQTHLIFTHLRVYDRTGKPFEGNAHLGYRYLVPEKDHLYGIYGAFDRKRTDYGNFFNQVTIGVEGWFRQVFVGGNYYQPIGDATKLVSIKNEIAEFDRIQNNIWFTADKQSEKAMGGGDAEFGYEFIKGLAGYVGGYYFSAKGVETLSGPKARVTYDYSLENGKKIAGIFDKLGLEIGGQNDKRGTTYYASANVRVGLSPNRDGNLQGVARHMVDLVRRDVDIVSSVSNEKAREVYRDAKGNTVKVVELKGDISDHQLKMALNDPSIHVVSVKGHIAEINSATGSINGGKILAFNSQVPVISPFTGKLLSVALSAPEEAGTLSPKAERSLINFVSPSIENISSITENSMEQDDFISDEVIQPKVKAEEKVMQIEEEGIKNTEKKEAKGVFSHAFAFVGNMMNRSAGPAPKHASALGKGVSKVGSFVSESSMVGSIGSGIKSGAGVSFALAGNAMSRSVGPAGNHVDALGRGASKVGSAISESSMIGSIGSGIKNVAGKSFALAGNAMSRSVGPAGNHVDALGRGASKVGSAISESSMIGSIGSGIKNVAGKSFALAGNAMSRSVGPAGNHVDALGRGASKVGSAMSESSMIGSIGSGIKSGVGASYGFGKVMMGRSINLSGKHVGLFFGG